MMNFLVKLIWYLPRLCVCTGLLFMARKALHYFQLESYQFHGYFKTIGRQAHILFPPYVLYGVVCALGFLIRYLIGESSAVIQLITGIVLCVYCVLPGTWISKKFFHGKEKKPFVKTARIKRLYISLAVVLVLVSTVLARVMQGMTGLFVPLVLSVLLPVLVACAALLVFPLEKLIQHLYFKDAQKKLLSNDRLIRIGITGSYGKTSVKFILSQILSVRYNVLTTPSSFNTPMGLTRIIRERLTPAHQIFIGEMGARHVGEIKELCDLVHPDIGILVSVGPQHMDTFRTQERITNTKYELIEALPDHGMGFFLNDDAIVTDLYEKTRKPKLLVGTPGSSAWAEDISVGSFGSRFMLCMPGEQPTECETKLLGEHNINNILLASAVAKYLGLTTRQISAGISTVTPVEHRMKIVSNTGGITVIDDAFNTNPRSSREALHILQSFRGRRIIVTPGMVELGPDEAKYNREFGEEMASSVDVAVLVGKHHAEPISEGLLSKGFAPDRLHTVGSLDEAVAIVHSLQQAGDVVLYENDLPDNYSEN